MLGTSMPNQVSCMIVYQVSYVILCQVSNAILYQVSFDVFSVVSGWHRILHGSRWFSYNQVSRLSSALSWPSQAQRENSSTAKDQSLPGQKAKDRILSHFKNIFGNDFFSI